MSSPDPCNTVLASCWESPLPPTASPHSAVGSSPGRLSADPGRRQSPCPSTQPPGVQGPCCEGQPWAPLPAHPASHHCSRPWKKAAVMSCPSDGAAGKPCSGTQPSSSTPAMGSASFRRSLQELLCIALHPVTYCVKGCEDFFPHSLSASSHPTLPLNLSLSCMSPLGACRQCPQPCCACLLYTSPSPRDS